MPRGLVVLCGLMIGVVLVFLSPKITRAQSCWECYRNDQCTAGLCTYQTTCGYLACTFRVPGATSGWCDVYSFTETCNQDSQPPAPSCHRTSGTFQPSCWIAPPAPSSTPGPGGGCGATCSDYCAGPDQCAQQGGTTVGSRCSGGSCSPGTAPCACLGSPGGGGGGGGGGPTAVCGDPCITTNENCKQPPAVGNPTICYRPPGSTAIGHCANPTCIINGVDYTQPGTICGCRVDAPLHCGQRCAGPCNDGVSICTYVNTGPSCPWGWGQTYCAGTMNGYSRGRCTSGDTGGGYLIAPGGRTTGITVAQITQSCTAASSCTITLDPNSLSLLAGQSGNMIANVTVGLGTVDDVTFTSSNTRVATVTSPDVTVPYATSVTGVGGGAATITATAIMGGVATCTTTASVNVSLAAWWQVKGGDVVSGGNVTSAVPGGNYLNLVGPGGYPGNVLYGNNISLNNPLISTTGWNGKSIDSSRVYNYDYLSSKIPGNVTVNDISGTASQASFDGGTVSSDTYKWFKSNGDLTIGSNIVIPGSNKIVLYVAGNLTINGRINIASPGQGFFMAIVTGVINVDGNLANGVAPALEGIFISNGFDTGIGNAPLNVRGSVVSYGSLALQRQAVGGSPAENFEFAPELTLLFPPELNPVRTNWKEVIP